MEFQASIAYRSVRDVETKSRHKYEEIKENRLRLHYVDFDTLVFFSIVLQDHFKIKFFTNFIRIAYFEISVLFD